MTSLDIDAARENMLINQIRAWEVLDPLTLEILKSVPRERFVPSHLRHLAFADEMLPIGHGQVMFAPKYEGRFLQALALRPADRVLEVGTGTGYMAALLAQQAHEVISVEIFEDLSESAGARLRLHGYSNVRVEIGDASRGWPSAAPYDAILVTGSMPILADEFIEQLCPGGRLAVVLGESPAMVAEIIVRGQHGDLDIEPLFDTDLPPLINARRVDSFDF